MDVLSVRDPHGRTRWHLTAALGDNVSIKRLCSCSNESCNSRDDQGNTALYYAAALDHVEIVSTLICHGADTNAVNYQKETALHAAASQNATEAMRCLLGSEKTTWETATVKDAKGQTALHLAAAKGHWKAVNVMCSSCFNCKVAQDNERNTALMLAVCADQLETVEWLLFHGSHSVLELCNAQGKTPLWWAVEHGQTSMCKLLLSFGASCSVVDPKGNSMLHLAACDEKTELLRLLLTHGADTTARDLQAGFAAVSFV